MDFVIITSHKTVDRSWMSVSKALLESFLTGNFLAIG